MPKTVKTGKQRTDILTPAGISKEYNIPYPTVRGWISRGNLKPFSYKETGSINPVTGEPRRTDLKFRRGHVEDFLKSQLWMDENGEMLPKELRGRGRTEPAFMLRDEKDGAVMFFIGGIAKWFNVTKPAVERWNRRDEPKRRLSGEATEFKGPQWHVTPDFPHPDMIVKGDMPAWRSTTLLLWGKKPNSYGHPRLDIVGNAYRKRGDHSRGDTTVDYLPGHESKWSVQEIAFCYGIDVSEAKKLASSGIFGTPVDGIAAGTVAYKADRVMQGMRRQVKASKGLKKAS